MLGQCEVLAIAAPLTPHTDRLIDRTALAACESALHILLMRKPRHEAARSKTSEPWMRAPGGSWSGGMVIGPGEAAV